MTAALLSAVALGGAAGAVMRYLVDRWAVARLGSGWPWGTLIVNVAGSLILGLLLGTVLASGLSDWWLKAMATGFCGALTTFSGFALQIVEMVGAPLAHHTAERQMSVQSTLRGLAYTSLSLGLGLLVAGAVPLVLGGVNSAYAAN